MLNFNFSEKSLGPLSPSHFVYDFSKKMTPSNLKLTLSFLSYQHYLSRQKLQYLENEKSFLGKIKSIFHYF